MSKEGSLFRIEKHTLNGNTKLLEAEQAFYDKTYGTPEPTPKAKK